MKHIEDKSMREWEALKDEAARPLTQAEKDILAAEISGIVYAGKTAKEIAGILNRWTEQPNPEPQPKIPYSGRPPVELYNLVFKSIDLETQDRVWFKLVKIRDEEALPYWKVCRDACELLKSDVTPLKLREEDGSPTELKQAILALCDLGVISAALASELIEYPDPNWPAIVPCQPIAYDLFGDGAYIEPADIKEVQ